MGRSKACGWRTAVVPLLVALAIPAGTAWADELPAPRPDLLVGRSSETLRGDDVYAGGQIVRRRSDLALERGFRVVLENDGAASGPLSLELFPSSRALDFRVFREEESIARMLVGTTFSTEVDPGERLVLDVVLRVPRWAEAGDWYGVTFTATTPDLAGVVDVATLATIVRR